MAKNNLAEIKKQIEELQKQANEIIEKERADVIADIREKISTYGITPEDLGLSSTKASKGKGKGHGSVAVKYKKGDDQWTGRGRKPQWVQDVISKEGFEALEKYKVQ